jgi:putative endonuclease
MSATSAGGAAEKRVVEYLKGQRYSILATNWRNRWCEIDIIAKKNSIVSFVEVKYRANDAWGGGFEAITRQKLQRMIKAAEAWVMKQHWEGDYELLAAAVDESSIELTEVYID